MHRSHRRRRRLVVALREAMANRCWYRRRRYPPARMARLRYIAALRILVSERGVQEQNRGITRLLEPADYLALEKTSRVRSYSD